MEIEKNKELTNSTPQSQRDIANQIVDAMANLGMIITEPDTHGEKIIEVMLSGEIVLCELDENNNVKKNLKEQP